MALWCYDFVVLLFYGFMVVWFYSCMVLWFCGFVISWFCSFMVVVLWFYSFMVLVCHGELMVSWFQKITKFPSHVLKKMSISYPRFPRLCSTDRRDLSVLVFS